MSFLLQIPNTEVIELTERPEHFPAMLGAVLFMSFCLIALARLSRPLLIRNLLVSWSKIRNLRAFVKESLPLSKRGSIFLLANFLLSAGVLVYLKLDEFEMEFVLKTVLALTVPIVLSFFGFVTLFFVGVISGEYQSIREPLLMRLIGIELLGLAFFIAALTLMLNAQFSEYVWWFLIVVVAFEFVSRIFKSVIISSANGASWFYIILYLCTLEILPLLIASYLILKNF